MTHNFRSDHDRLFHAGNQDRTASRVRPDTAKAVYATLLGVPPQTDGSYYVGFEAEGQHIGLVPGGGPQGMTSPVAYWHVPDIEAKLAEVTADILSAAAPARLAPVYRSELVRVAVCHQVAQRATHRS